MSLSIIHMTHIRNVREPGRYNATVHHARIRVIPHRRLVQKRLSRLRPPDQITRLKVPRRARLQG